MKTSIEIRPERVGDIEAITRLTAAAFANEVHSSHTEQHIVNALRRSGQLTVSLVAVAGDEVIGHVVVSPVTVSCGAVGWYGLGPISVVPGRQGQGVGAALMDAALAELRRLGGAGCVLLGEPGYYRRFGFKAEPGLVLPGVPAEYFQALAFEGEVPEGVVRYHAAFEATE